jgi:hypothetical protein
VEIDVYTMPNTAYQIWVLVGACCQETFEFFGQGNGLSVNNTSTEIGTRSYLQVRAPQGGNLPATHASHGGPKKPVQWSWMPLTQAYQSGSGGMKKFRLFTEHGGPAFSYFLITSEKWTRQRPRKSDLIEWERTK